MNFEITPNTNDKKWTCVFYWNEYTTLPTLELCYARYLQFAETVDKFTGVPKLIGCVQFKRPKLIGCVQFEKIKKIKSVIYIF